MFDKSIYKTLILMNLINISNDLYLHETFLWMIYIFLSKWMIHIFLFCINLFSNLLLYKGYGGIYILSFFLKIKIYIL